MHEVVINADTPSPGARDTVGGSPLLRVGQQVPRCRACEAEMVMFLQFDIRPAFGLPLVPGSHLVAFMCPNHNEIPKQCGDGRRAASFWLEETGMFALRLERPGDEIVARPDPYLVAQTLDFVEREEQVEEYDQVRSGEDCFKIGGEPLRINNDIVATCGCGAPMVFVVQLPENLPFPKQAAAPEQPDSFSSHDYCLFLGNIVYLLACSAQCDPQAVCAILDN